MTVEKFEKIEEWMQRYTFFGTPVYFEFLAGKRDLTCSAWAIPTRNIRGWKGPCYSDDRTAHYSSYAEMLEKVRVGQLRRGRRRGARQPLRELHGALRLRADGEPRPAGAARRHLEDDQIQLRAEAETDRAAAAKPLPSMGSPRGNGHLTGKQAEAGGPSFLDRKWTGGKYHMPQCIVRLTSSRCRVRARASQSAFTRQTPRSRDAIAARAGESASATTARRSLVRRALVDSTLCSDLRALHALARRSRRRASGALRPPILKRQLPEAAGIFIRRAERDQRSVKAYFALKLAGYSPDAPFMQRSARQHPAPRRHSAG